MKPIYMEVADEIKEFELVPYEFDGLTCYCYDHVVIFKRGKFWHAYGITENDEVIDTIATEDGTRDLDEMLKYVHALVD